MSIHDGPGIRSTVFLKGCNFRCRWCHNPETWSKQPQLQQLVDKCIGCSTCVGVCPQNAISLAGNRISIDRSKCDSCGKCAEACPSGSLRMTGKEVDSEKLVEELLADKPFYKESGGGVTISGGEPFAQLEFTQELLRLCKQHDIHTAIETNLSYPADKIIALLPLVDLWMVDLKASTPEVHKKHTLASNSHTKSNLQLLSQHQASVIVRTPVIPGVNDNEAEIEAICKDLSTLSILYYELLPFHSLGFDKFQQFGMENPMAECAMLDGDRLSGLNRIVNKYKLNKK